jgi:hypothetical protein
LKHFVADAATPALPIELSRKLTVSQGADYLVIRSPPRPDPPNVENCTTIPRQWCEGATGGPIQPCLARHLRDF